MKTGVTPKSYFLLIIQKKLAKKIFLRIFPSINEPQLPYKTLPCVHYNRVISDLYLDYVNCLYTARWLYINSLYKQFP